MTGGCGGAAGTGILPVGMLDGVDILLVDMLDGAGILPVGRLAGSLLVINGLTGIGAVTFGNLPET